MLFKSGDVFWTNVPENNTNDICGSRPVVILENIEQDKIKVIPLSSNTNNINKKIAVNLLLNDKVSYVSLMIDKVTVIPKEWIKSQMGSISPDIMTRLHQMVASMLITSGSCLKSNDKNDLTIFEESMELMKPYIVNSNELLENMVSLKTRTINIIVAIITGIAASIITNFIWYYIIF